MSAVIQKNVGHIIVVPCPICSSSMNLNNPINVGSVYECAKCGTESEIIDIHPLTLAPLEEEK